MPCTSDAVKLFIKNKIQYAPGKASMLVESLFLD